MPSTIRRPFWQVHPSAFLLAAQLLFMFFHALLDRVPSGRSLISVFTVVVLVLRIWVVNRSPALDWIAWILAVPSLILSLVLLFSTAPMILLWLSLLEAALYFYTAVSLIAYMMEDYRVTTDELFAIGATFTLLAWGFGHLYYASQAAIQGSLISTLHPDTALSFTEMLSFSFTNLTATGLSDIFAVTPVARVLVMLEQFAGVGYVAIVVSRLVGLTLQRQQENI